MFAQRMWGNNMDGNNPQYTALQNQMQDNQNANLIMDGIKGNASAISTLAANLNCDFNTLQQACCDVRNSITQVSGQIGYSAERVINAVNLGDSQVIQAIKDCCCGTQQAIQRMGYEQQLATCHQTNDLRGGQRDLGVAISEGFSKLGFQQASDKCEIIRAGQDNTQRLMDMFNTHWSNEQAREIQDLKAQISQFKQTDAIIARLGGNGCCGGNGCSGVGY